MGVKISLLGKNIDQKTNYDNKMCSVDVDEDYDIIESNIQSNPIDIVKDTIPNKIEVTDNLDQYSLVTIQDNLNTINNTSHISSSPQFSISPPINNDIIKINKKRKKRKNKKKN
jgi:hypothetical protein